MESREEREKIHKLAEEDLGIVSFLRKDNSFTSYTDEEVQSLAAFHRGYNRGRDKGAEILSNDLQNFMNKWMCEHTAANAIELFLAIGVFLHGKEEGK